MSISFEIDDQVPTDKRQDVKIEIKSKQSGKVEPFTLRKDLSGFEVLQCIANMATVAGVMAILRRAIADDDWERFITSTGGAKPSEYGAMAAKIVDEYTEFPTTPADGSSAGR